jgi:hypothetical protein
VNERTTFYADLAADATAPRRGIHSQTLSDDAERRPADRVSRQAQSYAFEKSNVDGIVAGGVPTTTTMTFRSVSSIARGSPS